MERDIAGTSVIKAVEDGPIVVEAAENKPDATEIITKPSKTGTLSKSDEQLDIFKTFVCQVLMKWM